jgi:hypothetical protein
VLATLQRRATASLSHVCALQILARVPAGDMRDDFGARYQHPPPKPSQQLNRYFLSVDVGAARDSHDADGSVDAAVRQHHIAMQAGAAGV